MILPVNPNASVGKETQPIRQVIEVDGWRIHLTLGPCFSNKTPRYPIPFLGFSSFEIQGPGGFYNFNDVPPNVMFALVDVLHRMFGDFVQQVRLPVIDLPPLEPPALPPPAEKQAERILRVEQALQEFKAAWTIESDVLSGIVARLEFQDIKVKVHAVEDNVYAWSANAGENIGQGVSFGLRQAMLAASESVIAVLEERYSDAVGRLDEVDDEA